MAAGGEPYEKGNCCNAGEQVEDTELYGDVIVERLQHCPGRLGRHEQKEPGCHDDRGTCAEARPVDSALFHRRAPRLIDRQYYGATALALLDNLVASCDLVQRQGFGNAALQPAIRQRLADLVVNSILLN